MLYCCWCCFPRAVLCQHVHARRECCAVLAISTFICKDVLIRICYADQEEVVLAYQESGLHCLYCCTSGTSDAPLCLQASVCWVAMGGSGEMACRSQRRSHGRDAE